MSEAKLDEVLDILESSSAAVAQLHKKLPALEQKYAEARDFADALRKELQAKAGELQQLTQESAQAIRAATDNTTAKQNETEKKSRALLVALSKLETTMAGLNQELSNIQQKALETQSMVSLQITSYDQLFQQMNSRLERLEITCGVTDAASAEVERLILEEIAMKDKEKADEDELATISHLYEKYQPLLDRPLIVVAPNWRSDYCFLVEQLDTAGNAVYAIGSAYQKGVLYQKTKRLRADSGARYRLYQGPSLNRILAAYAEAHS